MSKKLSNCKVCGAEMAAGAKACPKCGAKNKKPVYKKWWFYAIIVIVVIAAIGSAGGSNSDEPKGTAAADPPAATSGMPDTPEPEPEPEPDPEPEPISYATYDVTELFDALSGNALNAERTYQDQYVEILGYLATIDSDGKYITVGADPENWDYMLQSVHCTVTSDAQLDQIIALRAGDPITVRGKITDIGEIMGFVLDIDSIS